MDVTGFRAALLAWYDQEARDLPWRVRPSGRAAGETPNPYAVWLSEVMLQQTTISHAAPYWRAFLQRWPTVESLAEAEDAEVMSAWAGLGYYARARNLLACARVVSGAHGGAFPLSYDGLRGLPGVGDYTAAAVAAIAFDQAATVVDGNVERVVARVFAVETPLPRAKPELKARAVELTATDRPGDWAQAMMDLGAVVCRPKTPACPRCPVAEFCAARSSGSPEAYPRRPAKTVRPQRFGVAYRYMRGEDLALVRRPETGLLGGMLALPTSAWRAEPWTWDEAIAAAPSPGEWREVGQVEHVFTHFRLSLSVLHAEAEPGGDAVWSARVDDLPTVFRKAAVLGAASRSPGRVARLPGAE